MSLFAHNKGNYDPVTTAAINAAANKQQATPNTVNGGQVYKVFLPYNVAGGFTQNLAYVQLAATGNSFKLIDCPSSIIMKSDIFSEQIFHERTGQTFGQNFTSLSMKMNTVSAFPPNWNNLNVSASDVTVDGITVTLWVGNSSDYGFWDGRTQPARNSYELVVPVLNALGALTPFSVNANSSYVVSLTPQDGLSEDQNRYYGVNWAQFTLKEIVFSNLDSSNNLYITDGYNNIIMNVPASTTMRFPLPIYGLSGVGQNVNFSPYPDNPISMAVYNPSGSTVKFITSIVVWTNSLDYSIPV